MVESLGQGLNDDDDLQYSVKAIRVLQNACKGCCPRDITSLLLGFLRTPDTIESILQVAKHYALPACILIGEIAPESGKLFKPIIVFATPWYSQTSDHRPQPLCDVVRLFQQSRPVGIPEISKVGLTADIELVVRLLRNLTQYPYPKRGPTLIGSSL